MKLMVLDGNSIVNRAFYGIRLLSTKDGLYTNAVYGFLNILQKLLNEESPEGLCVTFDLKAPTFRHLKYEGYKAQRKPMPDELGVQIPVLKEVLDAMNIRRYELESYEADDLIGTISAKCEAAGWECVIVTGDKDSFQLITEKTHVRHVKSRMGQTEDREYDIPVFTEEYGFTPEKMVDLKALMGDASDNIPGVPGVGEKTALELIRRYGTIENLYRDLDALDVRDAVRRKLADGRDMAMLSYELATICKTVPFNFVPEENLRREIDREKLAALFQKLEFNKLMERFGLTAPAWKAAPKAGQEPILTRTVESAAAGEAMKKALASADRVGVCADDDLSEFVFYDGENAWILDKNLYQGNFSGLAQFVFGPEVRKAGHNIKELMRRLLESGLPTEGWVFDTALAAYLLEPTENSYELGKLTDRYCGFRLEDGADENGQFSMMEQEGAGHAKQAAFAAAVLSLSQALEAKLTELGMAKLLQEIELPLCPVLADMEHAGVLADREALSSFGVMLRDGEEALKGQIYAMAGQEFNINSPKQLGEVLFDKLMLPAPKKTKTGYSTNVDVMEKLRNKHPIVGLILEYRELAKLRSTYAEGLVREIAADGRIHTCYQMTVTATGRLSSTAPNLQNIPVRKELGGEFRKMFVAGEGNVLVDADYSQIELRLLAHISDDEDMKKAFLSGADIHRATASQVFGVPFEEVTELQRRRAKAVNFGIVYGISQFSLAQDIGVSVAEAKRYMDNYLSLYHGVRTYMTEVVEQAKKDGYVSTLYGRRRPIPELKAANHNIRSFGERVALNTPIQGTAADIMKIAMIRVHSRLRSEGLRAKLLLQIHDELIAECPSEETEEVKKILCEEMEHAASLSIPLTVGAGAGKSWFDAKE